ncbi:MAG: hypothetical protein HY951_12700 [Bacteroidia bacterium]|nr:hypothetical protein [Bacteroidia bacterium]
MKKIKVILLYSIAIILVFQSCKKGEDDPTISLRSRKARLVGEWSLTSGKITSHEEYTTTVTTYDGKTSISSVYGTNPYTEKMLFSKNGTFYIIFTNYAVSRKLSGYWKFGSEIKEMDLKNKEYVLLIVNSLSDTYPTGVEVETFSGSMCPVYTFKLKELKNKKLTVEFDGIDNWSTGYTSESGWKSFSNKEK